MTPATANRTRLSFDTLDARDMPSAVLPKPVPVAALSRVAAPDANTIDVRVPVASLQQQPALAAIASPGVTRVPPTALDQRIMQGLGNRKWVHEGNVQNPYTGTNLYVITEITLVGNGNFSMSQAGISPGIFAPVVYRMGSAGRWWVQNNGVLVMQNLTKSHSTLPNFDFMRVSSWGNGQFFSPDSGTWRQIPVNATRIPGF